MITYNCGTCGFIKDFTVQLYELKQEKCPKCFKIGTWQVYTGPMADTILSREDARSEKLSKDLVAAKDEYDKCKADLDNIKSTLSHQEFSYNARCGQMTIDEIKKEIANMEKIMDEMLAITNKYNDAARKYVPLKEQFEDLGNRAAVKKDAPKAYQMAANVQVTSGEDKLYIGNRQYVSQHGSKSEKKKARLLDVPNWSPGLNVAWVEGGVSAKARFKIKLKAGDPYADIPSTVLEKFEANPTYDAADFFNLCREEGKGSLLWYDKDGKNRPTWTALEIWVLLRGGYRFTFADSKHDGPGRKIVLVPPVG